MPGPREEVFCTKVGTTHPKEMYIVGAHMDGHGWGEAANDDGSGTALVMELARVFSSPDVQTERSIRFALWNNEETGLNGARAYVAQRQELQGKENPPGSGKYPEPKWLGMIQHDMMMFDHGVPKADGTMSPEQRCSYSGGCSPGDLNHSLKCEPVSACLALRRRASRSKPAGSFLASSLKRTASWARRSSRDTVCLKRRRRCMTHLDLTGPNRWV